MSEKAECLNLKISVILTGVFIVNLILSLQVVRGAERVSDNEFSKALEGRNAKQLRGYGNWLLEDNSAKALLVFEKLIELYPKDPQAKDAYFGKGKALLGQGRYLEAFTAIEESFPERPVTSEVVERCRLEFEIGQELAVFKNKILPGPKRFLRKRETGYQAAVRIFRRVIYNDPRGAIVPQVMFELGNTLFDMGELRAAYKTYLKLTQSFPDNILVDIARVKAAKCLANTAPENPRDAESVARSRQETMEAEELLKKTERSVDLTKNQEMKKEYDEARNLLSLKAAREQYEAAIFYLSKPDRRSKDSGIFVLKEILRRYPGTVSANDAKNKLIELGELVEGDKH